MTDSGTELAARERRYPLGPSLLDAEVHRDAGRYRQELDQVLLNACVPGGPPPPSEKRLTDGPGRT